MKSLILYEVLSWFFHVAHGRTWSYAHFLLHLELHPNERYAVMQPHAKKSVLAIRKADGFLLEEGSRAITLDLFSI
jgi:hypothetical protein